MTVKGFCLLSGLRFSKTGKKVVALAWFQGSRYRKCPAGMLKIPADDTWQRAGVSRVAKDGRGGPCLGLD